MEGQMRRDTIIKMLGEKGKPLSGTELAKELGVSRQVIVQDIALLRAVNKNILSTNKGYVLYDPSEEIQKARRTIAVSHSDEQTQDELYTIVDFGGKVLDVVIEHDIYGQITVDLILKSRQDVDEFIAKVAKSKAKPLKTLTGNKHFHTVEALDGVDFKVAEREFVSIIGKSGSGKSTLLHMIGGLDTPSSGTVIVDGVNLETLNSEQLALFRRRKVGFIFQQYNLIPDLNVYDNIIFPLELDGAQIDKEFIQELLNILNISNKQEMLPSMLSGGEQQRVAIIRALATKPAIILADEPTGNLDTATSHDVIGLLKMLSRQYQQTLIVITHDTDIAQMADRIVQIEDGKISKGSGFHVSE